MIGPIQAISSFILRAFDFSGRATRAEYWWSYLFISVLGIATIMNDFERMATMSEAEIVTGGVGLLVGLSTLWLVALTIIPFLSVTVRRLHDTGRSGWWYLVNFIPLIGPIWVFILTVLPSRQEANRFGPPPGETFRPIREGDDVSPSAGGRDLDLTGTQAAQTVARTKKRKPRKSTAWDSFHILVDGDKGPSPEKVAQQKAEVSDYYRRNILKQDVPAE